MSPHARRARRTSLRLPLVLFVAVLSLVGCTSGGAGGERERSDAAEPTVARIPTVLATDDLTLPLESYLLSPGQIRLLDRARLRLIDRCTTRFGFRYRVTLPTDGTGAGRLTDRRYGVTDVRAAARDGYGLGARDPRRVAPPRAPQLGPEAKTVLLGRGRSVVGGRRVPTGGCLGEANNVLAASAPQGANPDLAQSLSLESFQRSQQDSRVRGVFTAWSRCMSAQGYDYTDPLQPLADPQLGGGSGAEGRKVAGLDVQCKQHTNLVGVWYSVESAYQDRLIADRRGELDAVRRSIDAQLRAAESTLAAPGT